MLDAIYHDVENGVGPLTDFMQVFRDESGHMSFDVGRYLMHNALRQAFGQDAGVDPAPFGIDDEMKAYLDGVVRDFEPELLPPYNDKLPAGAGTVTLGEKTRVARGCERGRVPGSAHLTIL